MKKNSTVYLEKLENKPGIYIIFNIHTHKSYIGKATRLKERALQHIKQLYMKCDNNINLQEDFNYQSEFYIGKLIDVDNEQDLDKWEGIYYVAAKELLGEPNTYNSQKLKSNDINEINIAKEKIKLSFLRDTKLAEKYTTKKVSDIKDWIPFETVEKLKLETKSISKMFDNDEIEYLMFGKAGDYIGNNSPQTISDILEGKVEEIRNNHRCLWVTSGPSIDYFNEFSEYYKNNYADKKLYILFKLTAYPYSNADEEAHEYYWEKDGVKYICTSPEKKTVKALVLKNFYFVEEDFNFKELQKRYYKFYRPALRNGTTPILNNEIDPREVVTQAVSLSHLFNESNKKVRDALQLSPSLLQELKQRSIIDLKKFPKCNNDEHPIYYLLAEVEDYVNVSSKKSN